MKSQKIILSVTALFVAAILSSCSASKEETAAAKTVDVPKQEANTEPKLVAQENVVPAKKEEVAPAAAVPAKKEEVAPAAAVPVKKAEVAPAAAVPVKSELPCRHTVKTGDSLWRISVQYYGKGSCWKKIYDANKTVIRKENFLEPGTVLIIPVVK